MWPADFAPTLIRIRPRQKERLTSISLLDVCLHLSDCNFSFVSKWTFVLSGNVCFMSFVGERVCVSDVWRLIPLIWYTVCRYNTHTLYVIRIRYDSSPPSCGLLVEISNTSLRIKDECLIFTTAKICSNVNKLTSQKNKTKPSLNSNSETSFELHTSLWILYFGVFRFKGGWVGIPPFFTGSVTHPNLTAFTHPNAGVFARVLRKQELIPYMSYGYVMILLHRLVVC